MAIKLAEAFVEITARTSTFTKQLGGARGILGKFTSSFGRVGSAGAGAFGALGSAASGVVGKLAGVATGIGGVVTATLGLGSAIGALGLGVKLAADAEQAEVAFTTIIGSGEAAKSLLAEISEFAATTPFQLADLRNASKQLLAFGFSAEEVIPNLRAIGDVASGVGAPVGEIAAIFGKARSSGLVFTETLNQFTDRGIPILSALAAQFGVTEAEVRKFAANGKISFADLQKAFADLTEEGGQFEGQTLNQSQTLAGLFSTLKDNISFVLKEIGEGIIEAFNLKGAITNATDLAQVVKTNFVPTIVGGIKQAIVVLDVIIESFAIMRTGFKVAVAAVANAGAILIRAFADVALAVQDIINLIPGVNVTAANSFAKFADNAIMNARQVSKEAGASIRDTFGEGPKGVDRLTQSLKGLQKEQQNTTKEQKKLSDVLVDEPKKTADQIEKERKAARAKEVAELEKQATFAEGIEKRRLDAQIKAIKEAEGFRRSGVLAAADEEAFIAKRQAQLIDEATRKEEKQAAQKQQQIDKDRLSFQRNLALQTSGTEKLRKAQERRFKVEDQINEARRLFADSPEQFKAAVGKIGAAFEQELRGDREGREAGFTGLDQLARNVQLAAFGGMDTDEKTLRETEQINKGIRDLIKVTESNRPVARVEED